MSLRAGKLFNYDKSVNAMLYVLMQYGGIIDMHKLCKTFYFADQKHLSEFGRSITGDTYIAMQYGPVPSNIDDILKAVRGDSFFASSPEIAPLKQSIVFENKYYIRSIATPDMDALSASDIECLNYAIELCRDKSFNELTAYSHGLAWSNTMRDREMSVKDILREVGDEEPYVDYIAERRKLQSSFL